MGNRVLVIGNPPHEDPLLGEVLDKLSQTSNDVLHCRNTAELVTGLSSFALESIDVLDIFDHGAPGAMQLGDEILFASDDDPTSPLVCSAVDQIERYLSPNAHVRLLGCDTAEATPGHSAGRLLLLKLAYALGKNRTVFGTLAPVDAEDFDNNGFIDERAIDLLYSSRSALDYSPPTYYQRQINLGMWRPFPPGDAGPHEP